MNLDIAAKILIGDANIDRSDYSKFKSKYNIENTVKELFFVGINFRGFVNSWILCLYPK